MRTKIIHKEINISVIFYSGVYPRICQQINRTNKGAKFCSVFSRSFFIYEYLRINVNSYTILHEIYSEFRWTPANESRARYRVMQEQKIAW